MPSPSSFTTLGTGGGPRPDPRRAQPAHLLMIGESPVLVDCGEGAMSGLAKVGIDYRHVEHIFLTHHHFDHIGSLFACLGLNMMVHRRAPLTVYGPPGTGQIVDSLLAACDVPNRTGFGSTDQALPHPRSFTRVRELSPGDVVEIPGARITCCENTHYRPESDFATPATHVSLSLRFDLVDRSIVFTGDTGVCAAVEALARGVDLLIGEMVDAEVVLERFRKSNPGVPPEREDKIRRHMLEHHLTAEQLGEMAQAAGAKTVVAVHLTNGAATPDTIRTYAARIASRFGGEVRIAEDGQSH